MTIPESAASSLLDPPGARASHAAFERLGRWVARRGWIHVLLITGVAGCVYPIVWMFMTSIKTDEELGQSEMAPSLPTFRSQSPYVRGEIEVTKPDDVDASRFASLLPKLREMSRAAVLSNLPREVPPSIDREGWVSSAASALLSRAL